MFGQFGGHSTTTWSRYSQKYQSIPERPDKKKGSQLFLLLRLSGTRVTSHNGAKAFLKSVDKQAKKTFLIKLNYRKKVFYFALNFLPWEFLLIKKLDFEKTKAT